LNEDFLRMVESIHKDKGVDKEVLFTAVEQGLASAAKKRYNKENVTVTIDRHDGKVTAMDEAGNALDVTDLGRIAARTAYQVMTQKIREAASTVLVDEFQTKVGSIVVGTVQRFERGNMIVTLDRAEAIVPRSEQVYNESYRPGDRIRALLLEIRRERSKVQMVMSRTNEEFVRQLFMLEVPEISEGTVIIQNLVRDPVGAYVGVRGSRIRTIVDELNGEHIDIVPWSSDMATFIRDALRPAEITDIVLDNEHKRAAVRCSKEDLSRAIGRRGQNVRLSSKLVGWEIDVSGIEGEVAAEGEAEKPAEAKKPETEKEEQEMEEQGKEEKKEEEQDEKEEENKA